MKKWKQFKIKNRIHGKSEEKAEYPDNHSEAEVKIAEKLCLTFPLVTMASFSYLIKITSTSLKHSLYHSMCVFLFLSKVLLTKRKPPKASAKLRIISQLTLQPFECRFDCFVSDMTSDFKTGFVNCLSGWKRSISYVRQTNSHSMNLDTWLRNVCYSLPPMRCYG